MDQPMEQDNGESPFGFSPNRTVVPNTRVLDNHYDPTVHEKPWITAGHLRDYKYEYSDSGLGFVMKKSHKLRNFPERHEQKQEVEELNKKNKGFRHFREYENVANNDIIITIEYCTNCKQHQGSTRHDEEKYASYANTLKREIISQYPIVKVILKPLIFEQNDQSTETLYLRTRIGAFEVQLYGKSSKGKVKKQYIFSKLYSKNWPSVSKVVDDISKFLPTDDFVVRLVDPNYDAEETKQNDTLNKTQTNKLKGLHVILRPLRSTKKANATMTELSTSSKIMNESSRFGPGGTSRPNSAAVRPQSAYSTTSNKSMLSTKKALQERNENFSTTAGSNIQPKEFVGQSDNFGVVLFKQIPHNIYEVELLETQNYLPDKKIVNIFDMVEKNQILREEIILQEQTMGFCRVKITDGGMPFGDASIIIAKKFPDKSSKTAVLREKDLGSGLFEFMIDPGEYILSINKMGFGERKEEITAGRGINDLYFDVRQPSSHVHNEEKIYERPISASKPEERPSSRQRPTSSKGRPPSSHGRPTSSNGRPDPSKLSSKGNLDVIQQENMEASPVKKSAKNSGYEPDRADTDTRGEEERGTKQKNERVKSALVKKVEFSIFDVDSEKPVSGVQVILEEIGFRGITNEQGRCLVPINKLTQGKLILNHDAFFGMVEEYGGDEGIDLKNASEKKFYLISRPSDINEVQLRFLPGRGIQCCQFSVLYDKDDESAKKDVIVQHAEGGKEIIILKNLLKKHGVFRIIAEIYDLNEFFHPESTFILSHYADCDPLYIFPPDESDLQGSQLIWDVGFFADPVTNPQFIEINGYSNTEITLYSHLKEYQMLLNYLHNSKSDLKTLLGFKEKNRVEKDGDVLIPKETIYASLDKYGLEIKNVDHLLSSARGSDGLYSLRECERRFESLRPPFNFVKVQKKDDYSGSEGSSEEGEEEYLYEDDQ